jgi:hypothetical protein
MLCHSLQLSPLHGNLTFLSHSAAHSITHILDFQYEQCHYYQRELQIPVKPRIIRTIHSMIVIAALLMLLRNTSSSQTFIGIDTLSIKSSKSRSAIVQQADTNVTLKLPKSSGTIALESNGITTAASTGTAISYVADTTIYGGDWVTVAELQVDSGKGGILEYYFHATAANPVWLFFSEECRQNVFGITSCHSSCTGTRSSLQLTCGGPFPKFPICLPGTNNANYGYPIAPFVYNVETSFDGIVWEEIECGLYRKGIIWAKFQPQALTANNLDLQNNYQLAVQSVNFPDVAYDTWHKKYLIVPTSSGRVRFKVKNYRGMISRGIGTVNDCCGNVMVNVLSNVRLQRLRLILH